MARLTSTPSNGQSEVLETLHYQGALAGGVPIVRIGPMVSARWGGTEDREGSDAQFETDLLAVLSALQTAGYVTAHDVNGTTVDLTGTPAKTAFVVLTGAGRATARHPRPRPVRISD